MRCATQNARETQRKGEVEVMDDVVEESKERELFAPEYFYASGELKYGDEDSISSEDELYDEEDEHEAHVDTKTPKETSPLHKACATGDIDAVSTLLSTFPPSCIDLCDPTTRKSPMELACKGGHEEIVKRLVAHGAQSRPLFEAIEGGNAPIVKLLLESGANVNEADELGFTRLHVAASSGNAEIVKLLLEHGADPSATTKKIGEYEQPIHTAAHEKHAEIVKLLLQYHARVNACDRSGNTPLLLAAENGCLEAVKVLISKGADVNATNKNKDTPLIHAVREQHVEIAKLLLQKGADYLVLSGAKAMLTVACSSNLEILLELLKYDKTTTLKSSAIVKAAEKGKTEIIEWFRKLNTSNYGSHMSSCTDISLLGTACRHGHFELAKMLVLQGNVDLKKADQILEYACGAEIENVELVEFLLEHGARVNGSREAPLMAYPRGDILFGDSPGDSPVDHSALGYAVRRGHAKIAEVLLKHGAFGSQILFLSACGGSDNLSVVEVLWEYGIGDMAGEQEKTDALFKAVKQLNVNIARFLIAHGALVLPVPQKQEDSIFALLIKKKPKRVTLHLVSDAKGSGRKKVSMAKLLLENGVSLHEPDTRNQTPLTLAITNGSLDLVWYYSLCGANLQNVHEKSDVWRAIGKNRKMLDALLHFWTPATHHRHPSEVKDAIKCLLLISKRQKWLFGIHVLHQIFAYLAYGWIPDYCKKKEPPQQPSIFPPFLKKNTHFADPVASSKNKMRRISIEEDEDEEGDEEEDEGDGDDGDEVRFDDEGLGEFEDEDWDD